MGHHIPIPAVDLVERLPDSLRIPANPCESLRIPAPRPSFAKCHTEFTNLGSRGDGVAQWSFPKELYG